MNTAQPMRRAPAGAVDSDFERLYQQAYYRHSGFGPDAEAAPARPRLAAEFTFAALALVFFVVPAVTAALVV
ncbi:MAG: hypothetical protein KA795_09440 [Burkholderiaceae bacterium]|nr:hypothetical protein [Burkholderiaceae bacterium]